MKKFRISKGNGKFRTIYAPSTKEKEKYRSLARDVADRVEALDLDCIHGFRRGRSPVTNALAHVGFRYTLSMDLSDFFDSVTFDKITCFYPVMAAHDLTVDGAARQGLPSSPVVANLVASKLDRLIVMTLANFDSDAVYTRYADDLTISSNNESILKDMVARVIRLAAGFGFTVNESKTKLQCADAGRRMVTGVAVGPDGIHCPRSVKRRLRAAEYNAIHGKRRRSRRKAHACARGLREWARLKPPHIGRAARAVRHELHLAMKNFALGRGEFGEHQTMTALAYAKHKCESLLLKLWCLISNDDYDQVMAEERKKAAARLPVKS